MLRRWYPVIEPQGMTLDGTEPPPYGQPTSPREPYLPHRESESPAPEEELADLGVVVNRRKRRQPEPPPPNPADESPKQ